MEPLNEERREHFSSTFALYTSPGENRIEARSLGNVLRGVGLNPSQEEIERLVTKLEALSSEPRKINFEEFMRIYESMKFRENRKKSTKEDFIKCFSVYSESGDGTIPVGMLKHVMSTLGEAMTDKQLDALVQGLVDHSGNIDIEEFVMKVMNG